MKALKLTKIIFASAILMIFISGSVEAYQYSNSKKNDEDNKIEAKAEINNIYNGDSSFNNIQKNEDQNLEASMLRILDNKANDEYLRINAALTLYKLGSRDGIKFIRDCAQFDENENVKFICEMIYRAYMNEV